MNEVTNVKKIDIEIDSYSTYAVYISNNSIVRISMDMSMLIMN